MGADQSEIRRQFDANLRSNSISARQGIVYSFSAGASVSTSGNDRLAGPRPTDAEISQQELIYYRLIVV